MKGGGEGAFVLNLVKNGQFLRFTQAPFPLKTGQEPGGFEERGGGGGGENLYEHFCAGIKVRGIAKTRGEGVSWLCTAVLHAALFCGEDAILFLLLPIPTTNGH